MNGTEIVRLAERAASTARPEGKPGPLRTLAEGLSRRNAYAARAAVLNDRLSRLIELLYEADGAGELLNVDPVTGRVLVGLPWGRLGKNSWGLTGMEAEVLRSIMLGWGREAGALFQYDSWARSWAVDLAHYPTLGEARGYLVGHTVTLELWRRGYQAWRDR